MNKIISALCTGVLLVQGGQLLAQPDKDNKMSEIIIHQNGEKEKKITVVIDGEQVIVNGKPMEEFNEDGINVRRRKMIINEGPRLQLRGMINGEPFDFGGQPNGNRQRNRRTTIKQDSITFFGVQTSKMDISGATVTEVIPGSAADMAGLQEGDIITKVDKDIIEGPESLTKIIRGHQPNDKVEISFLRNNKKKKAKASLQSKVISTQTTIVEESDEADVKPEREERESDNKFDLEQLNGIFPELEKKLKDLNIDVSLFPKKQKLGLKIQDTENEKGVQILEVADSSLAANAGLIKGDLITQIDGQNINNTDEARMKLHEIEGRPSYFIKLLRKSKEMQVEIKTPKPLKTADL